MIWLVSLTIMVFLIIIIGGLTRLTDSGLSMVDWQPILGIIPPLNDEQWNKVFEMYISKKFTLNIFKKYSLNEIVKAHQDLENRRILGPAIIIP